MRQQDKIGQERKEQDRMLQGRTVNTNTRHLMKLLTAKGRTGQISEEHNMTE
jgi:hypothetical protein